MKIKKFLENSSFSQIIEDSFTSLSDGYEVAFNYQSETDVFIELTFESKQIALAINSHSGSTDFESSVFEFSEISRILSLFKEGVDRSNLDFYDVSWSIIFPNRKGDNGRTQITFFLSSNSK